MLTLPEQFRDLPLIASVSGGKDSTAMMLALREAGLPFRAVFADTGWEAVETYAHLDVLRAEIGRIDVVRADHPSGCVSKSIDVLTDGSRVEYVPTSDTPRVITCLADLRLTSSAMVERIRANGRFAGRTQRWCTRELKLIPLRRFHDATSDDTVSVVGVRRDESKARASARAVEDDCEWGGWIWRPMVEWSVADVLAAHHRAGISVNPLYERGHDRVGCYPCINSTKGDIALIAEHAPDRIRIIRELEREASALRAERNVETPDRYAHEQASFFQGRTTGPLGIAPQIDAVVAWSRTSRGGRQLPLLAEPPSGGCFRWGLCEPPSKDGDE